MGMSTHVVGFKPPGAKWKAMKKVWDACAEAKIDPPEDVSEFFGGEPPDEQGVEVPLDEGEAVRDWGDGHGREGFEVDVAKLPKDVTVVRFYNSY